ncbi:hypothetical protein KDW63_09680 [Burkholderia cenocepacia]|uniref:hypothetical protein n=1 Tax=Burkholderia cenocepacia TaxID=95486 RepID=UPI001B955D42|nr:hypothetical protein [Burkholderia cenocepacia]MBR8069560.1 hypothetical protein [Burkholderia cenocepacia]MBR8294451.1 hypothetical protein [Burkholderia cenocepacia]MBR8444628.1 hypothetical protein [Burkholderia cenocepacia]
MPIDTFLAERTAISHANGLPVPDSALPHVLRGAKALGHEAARFQRRAGKPCKWSGVLPA